MLRKIQGELASLYDLHVGATVDDFVCDAEVARAALGSEDPVVRGEALIVAEEPDGVSVGLYLDPDAMAALEQAQQRWEENCFKEFCLATEGVSHFLYLMFRAENEDPVSQLELELQAEVDKYASALLAGQGVGLIQARSRLLRKRLFSAPRFRDAPGTEEGDRYRVAHRVAARYAARLERRHLTAGDLRGLFRELRRFYRMGMREKVEAAGGV